MLVVFYKKYNKWATDSPDEKTLCISSKLLCGSCHSTIYCLPVHSLFSSCYKSYLFSLITHTLSFTAYIDVYFHKIPAVLYMTRKQRSSSRSFDQFQYAPVSIVSQKKKEKTTSLNKEHSQFEFTLKLLKWKPMVCIFIHRKSSQNAVVFVWV